MDLVDPPHLGRGTVDGLLQVARDLSATADLPTMVATFVRAITEIADFECAAINLVRADGDLQVVAVAGPPAVEKLLMDTVGRRAHWDAELTGGHRCGVVQLHLEDSVGRPFPAWVDDDVDWFERTAGDPRAWQPGFAAYVPMCEPDGSLLGVISVDLPRSGRIPDQRQCATLEILARQAESAIRLARETARSALDEHTFGSVFEIAGAPMCVADEHGRFTHANRRFRESFGGVADIGTLDSLLLDVEGAESLQAEVDDILAGRIEDSTFVAGLGEAEGRRCFHVSLRGAAYSSPTPARIVCTMSDITDERRAREMHRHDAEHDHLTGLLNRRGLRRAIDAVVRRLVADEVLVVICFDLDEFRLANNLRGHHFGDGVLVEVADLLRRVAPSPAVVGRMGGDEFVIVTRCDSQREALAMADALVRAIDLPLPGAAGRVTASVGVATAGADAGVQLAPLFQRADRASYAAKLAGGARWVLAGA